MENEEYERRRKKERRKERKKTAARVRVRTRETWQLGVAAWHIRRERAPGFPAQALCKIGWGWEVAAYGQGATVGIRRVAEDPGASRWGKQPLSSAVAAADAPTKTVARDALRRLRRRRRGLDRGATPSCLHPRDRDRDHFSLRGYVIGPELWLILFSLSLSLALKLYWKLK